MLHNVTDLLAMFPLWCFCSPFFSSAWDLFDFYIVEPHCFHMRCIRCKHKACAELCNRTRTGYLPVAWYCCCGIARAHIASPVGSIEDLLADLTVRQGGWMPQRPGAQHHHCLVSTCFCLEKMSPCLHIAAEKTAMSSKSCNERLCRYRRHSYRSSFEHTSCF